MVKFLLKPVKKNESKKDRYIEKKVFQKNLSFIENALTRFSCKASMITLNESDLLLYNLWKTVESIY